MESIVLPPPAAAKSVSKAAADDKLAPLEMLRGLAAFSVFAIHLLIGFAPANSGYIAESAPPGAIGGILFAPYDGPALLAFFFLLSGFVLSRSVFLASGSQGVVRGLLKRWPRLALLCLISTLLSWAFWRSGLYFHQQAAAITGSPWLGQHVVPGPPGGGEPTLWRAVRQGGYAVFASGEVWLNTSLWTMRIELLGSLVSIGLAPVFLAARSLRAVLGLAAVLGFILFTFQPFLLEFVIGTTLARLLYGRQALFPVWLARGAIAVAIAMLIASKPVGDLVGLERLGPNVLHVAALPVSAVLIVAALSLPGLRTGRTAAIGRAMGHLAFATYVLHMPMLCSLGSWLLVRATASGMSAVQASVLAAFATVVTTICFAWPLAGLDRWWVRHMGRWTSRALA